MSNTLFNGSSHSNRKLDTCICRLLDELSNTTMSLCSNGPVRLLIILKGTSEPLSLNGGMNGTEFTLVRFDRETGCAVFSFTEGGGMKGGGMNNRTRTIVLDCRCICSVVCLGSQDIRPY